MLLKVFIILYVSSHFPFFFCELAVYGLGLDFLSFHLFHVHLSEIFIVINISINIENISVVFNTIHFNYGGFYVC